ncbi:single-stranded DNA-binding protein [Boudabousia liubingyangii]|uniref:Single-stranded DNA-binding protein n=1 Tax=Boudabousia liubingyangii TaxID=1921764 RepID=A0A1Q5PPF1_9ACTO|nr:R3H domain-containing nucleic acid-binding protein [Boudabousia liubingyangii]OKL48547.1 single-stranded DNA-binding protein [Boudabousia liubingyangii]OKL49417.1 single-stranded DNA-binding protein [Boudabousia liubingyangii]
MSTEKTELIKRLEAEGDIAADYLEELLDIIDVGGEFEIDVERDRATVEIVDDEDERELRRLVGRDGAVLDALQELTRLVVQNETGERSRLMLDIAGHRKAQRQRLAAIAEEAVTRAQATGEPVRLEPMNPFERKVCHDVVSAAGLFSDSEGTPPNRRVVIYLEEPEVLVDEEDDEA